MQLPRSPASRNPLPSGPAAANLRPSPRRRILWWLAWVAASAGLLLFARTLDLRAVLSPLATARPGWILVAVLANLAVWPLFAAQWSRLLPAGHAVGRGVMSECVALALAGMNTLPFGGGHALAVGLLAKRARLGLDGALSLMALEQLCEGVAKIALLLLALAAAPLPAPLPRVAWILAAALLAGSAGLLWLTRRPASGLPLAGWRARWAHHLEAVNRPSALLAALGLGLLAKAAQLAAIFAAQRSLGVDLPLPTLALVLTAVSFATSVAVAPGNLVVYEAAAFALYRWLGVPSAEALSLALVQHACFLAPMILPGYAFTAWRALIRPGEK